MKRSRAILCSIDGMRPDGLLAADTPVIDSLARGGASTMLARTVLPCCTLPCHTSMFRGVVPERHGITSNDFHPIVRPVPSIVETAHGQGRRTGAFYNWEQLRDLASPGSLDVSFAMGSASGPEADQLVAHQAARFITEMDLDFAFVYFGWTDECGHLNGWMSDQYVSAISHADRCLGYVLDAIRQSGNRDETTVLVTADHGGHARTHGEDIDEDMLIPWILNGPGVRAGVTLIEPVRIQDTCVTLGHMLSLTPPVQWEGRVVREALE